MSPEDIEKLWKSAGSGNYRGDVYGRGWNAALEAVLVSLGLDTKETAEARFRHLAREHEAKSLASVERYNAERRAEGAE